MSSSAAAIASSSAAVAGTNKPEENNFALYNADARLMVEFERTQLLGKFFNYSKSVLSRTVVSTGPEISAYLQTMQRGGFIQSIGCVLIVEESNFNILAFSENIFDKLGLRNLEELQHQEVMSLIGFDARNLFTPSSTPELNRAMMSDEITFFNPIWVNSKGNNTPFYAILHRTDEGVIIDLEPSNLGDPTLIQAGTLEVQKIAAKSISKLEIVTPGDMGVLCDTVAEEVQKLTGYDRVMVYKFHEDGHGEVVSKINKTELESFRGVHYPAVDIPQAARFLFKKNGTRMIYNCRDAAVRVIQSEALGQPVSLMDSTLRAPHQCHAQYMSNMGSLASLVMALCVNNDELWGMVVCHHTSRRYTCYPLRYACEFLMRAFSLKLQMELRIEAQIVEKNVFRVQSQLSDMLLRGGAPPAIMTQSPNIMNLVKCDGAALYYNGKCWFLGVTPTISQLEDIVKWLLITKLDDSSAGLITDSLVEAGYPGADVLGDAVCGMATARLTGLNFVFWFRSHTANELRWGGAKHVPEDIDDEGGRMHPRASFKAFLEEVRHKSLQWEAVEINAIYSLQLIIKDFLKKMEGSSSQVVGLHLNMDELSSTAVEMARLIETAAAPIFGVDSAGVINMMNSKMCELIGLEESEALGKSLIDHVIHEDSREFTEALLAGALQGEEEKNVEVKVRKYGVDSHNSAVYIRTNVCTSRDSKNDVVGATFVGQDVTAEKMVTDKFMKLQGDYKTILESASPLIPPMFASDMDACCCEWNARMEKLTGWTKHEVIGKMLPEDVFGNMCHLKSPDLLTKFMILLYRAIGGHDDTEKLPFGFFNKKGEFVDVYLTATKREDANGKVIGCLCFMQMSEKKYIDKKIDSLYKELAYIFQETKNPLSGIRFLHQLFEGSDISDEQRSYIETSYACERQILSIINDRHFESLEKGKMEFKLDDFFLGSLMKAVVGQVMNLINEKHLHLVLNIPDQIYTLRVYGDQMKLQVALSDFFRSTVNHAPSPNGWVEIGVSCELNITQGGDKHVHLKFRMAHPGKGLPDHLITEMNEVNNDSTSQEGMTLNISKSLVSMMNGNVYYVNEENQCYFHIELELKL